jgi:hypothetical protein
VRKHIYKPALTTLTVLTSLSLVPVEIGWAQIVPPPADTFTVGFFVDANTVGIPDRSLLITNPGVSGGDLCAMIYLYSDDGEMAACCGCMVPMNSLRMMSFNDELLGNPLTRKKLTNGVIKIISSSGAPVCDPQSTNPTPSLVSSTAHAAVSKEAGGVEGKQIEHNPKKTTLSFAEKGKVETECHFAKVLGSGRGVCGCGSQGGL